MTATRPVIGFYSEFDDPIIWRARLEDELPDFTFEILRPDDVKEVRYALVWNPPHGLLSRLKGLEAIFVLGAGVDALLTDPSVPNVPIIRLQDAGMGIQMAHYVAYGVLRFQREFAVYEEQQASRDWNPLLNIEPIESFGIGVLGLGAIGSRVVETMSHLGFPARGWSASGRSARRIETLSGDSGLKTLLSCSRVLVNLLPLTPNTERFYDKNFFDQIKPGTFFSNLGRGNHVVEDDLIQALDADVLSGTLLDVFNQEPLQSSSPLWHHPKVLITPHVSGLTNATMAMDQIISNLKLIEAGSIPTGLVDRHQGY